MDYDINILINKSIIVNNDVHVWCNWAVNDFYCNYKEYDAIQKRVELFGHLNLSCLKGGAAFSKSCWVGKQTWYLNYYPSVIVV